MSKATSVAPSALSSLITAFNAKSAAESLAISILHNLQYQHNWTDLRLHLVHIPLVSGYNGSRNSNIEVGTGLVDLEGWNFHHPNSSSRTASPSRSESSSGSTTPTLDGAITIDAPTPSQGYRTTPLISGLPPQHSYIHPDLQTHLIKHKIKDTTLSIQREFVLPLSLGERWTLSRFCSVFDALPAREAVNVQPTPPDRTRTNGSAHGSGGSSMYEHKDQKRVILGMRANEGMGGDGTVVYYIMQEGEVKPRQNG